MMKIQLFLFKYILETLMINKNINMHTIKVVPQIFRASTTTSNTKSWVG